MTPLMWVVVAFFVVVVGTVAVLVYVLETHLEREGRGEGR